ncbi:MAG: hypothetical protein JXR81_03650 [Candidatus Goldbacteria bacterium]|nr:hypothetical protein [Candidatus Goldiibacteriota bacterium]
MKKILAVMVLVLSLFSFSAVAADLSGNIYTAGVSKYLWRGQQLSEGFAVQPGFNLNLGNLSFGYWGSYDIEAGQYSESDYTFSFSESLPGLDIISLGAGFTVYTFPYADPAANNDTEVFGTVSADVVTSPYVKFFYDPTFGAGGYLEAGISYSVELEAFEPYASVTGGYNFGQWGYEASASVVLGTIGVTYTLDKFSATLSGSYQLALDAQYENDGFGTLSVDYGF